MHPAERGVVRARPGGPEGPSPPPGEAALAPATPSWLGPRERGLRPGRIRVHACAALRVAPRSGRMTRPARWRVRPGAHGPRLPPSMARTPRPLATDPRTRG